MFVAVVLLCILSQVSGEVVRYRCSDIVEDPVSFTPVAEVLGRYKVEACPGPDTHQNLTLWEIELWYFQTCKKRNNLVHSVLKDQAIKTPTNCSNVCYSVMFDAIFSGCYEVRSDLKGENTNIPTQGGGRKYPVNNSLTLDSIKNSIPQVVYIPRGNDVTLNWMLNVPIPYEHKVSLQQRDNTSSQYWHPYPDEAVSCVVHDVTQLWCNLTLEPGKCYEARMQLEPPWYPMLYKLTDSMLPFCLEAPAAPQVEGAGGGGGAWWALGGALLALGALLAALLVRRAFRDHAYHKRVFEAWKRARECEAAGAVDVKAESHNVLLLYAREGEHGQRAVAALKALLQHCFDGQVLDVYAADVMALAAPAPGAWLRAALEGARTKVLLLQSPALLQLYATTVRDTNMQLQEPLLGRGALYRRPHFGDALVLLALRLMSEAVGAHHSYHKYYLATYSGLPGELVPSLVPYRRYEFPRAAHALLRDLAPPTPPAHDCPAPAPAQELLVQDFERAADEFIDHATANPDYLAEELITM